MAPSVSTLSTRPAYRYDHVREATCADVAPAVEPPVLPPGPRYGEGDSCSAPPAPPTRPVPSPPPSPAGTAGCGIPPDSPPVLLPSPRPLRAVASEASLKTLSLLLRRSAGGTAAGGGSAGTASAATGRTYGAVTRELALVGRLYGAAGAAAARRASAAGAAIVAAAVAASPPPSRLAAAVGLPACAVAALPSLPTYADFCAYYNDRLRGADGERRLYEVLRGDAAKVPVAAVAATVRALLSARGSPLYERNARIAVETVLYGLHADPLVTAYSPADLAGPRLAASLTAAETTGMLTGALASLAPGRFAGMLMDWTDLLEDAAPGIECSCPAAAAAAVAAEAAAEAAAARAEAAARLQTMSGSWASSVSLADDAAVAGDVGTAPSDALLVPGRGVDGGVGGGVDGVDVPLGCSPPSMSVISASSSADSHLLVPEPACSPHTLSCEYHSGRGAAASAAAAADGPAEDGETWVCAGSLNAFCEAKGLLTPRAVATVVRLYGRHGRLSSAGFCRLFQALTTCGSVGSAVGYWFRVLDHDLDGVVGAGDVRHYYAHKRVLGHAAEPDVVLTCVRHVWTRLVAMAGGRTGGLRPRDFRVLTDMEREFVLCALLVRRVDDGGLVNVRATLRLTSDEEKGGPLGVVS